MMEQGQQKYPEYDALWHLVSMGVLKEDHTPNGWKAGSNKSKTRVAVIDTSVATSHPNLEDAIDKKRAFDLFSTRLGAFPFREPKEKVGDLNLNASTKVAENLPRSSELLAELIDRLSHDNDPLLGGVWPMTSSDFSNHGTAVCGLIGARPVVANVAKGFPQPIDGLEEVPLPYMGVDPSCEIVPISTHLDADPETLILALLYAELIDADVIHIPRMIPDPTRTVPELHHAVDGADGAILRDLVAHTYMSEAEMEAWEELASLLVKISLRRPIVCAAGNANEEHGIYPANLADEHNGIISVGAVNAKGYSSGYSATAHVTVCGPSDDTEVHDRNEIRLDPHSPLRKMHPEVANQSNKKHSSFDIISTDVPGAFGYASSPFFEDEPDDGLREFGSYFCRFGGTSASSALVAGLLALARSTGELKPEDDGLSAKAWLAAHSKTLPDDAEEFKFAVWTGQPTFPDQSAD